jgi:hypothetical protein
MPSTRWDAEIDLSKMMYDLKRDHQLLNLVTDGVLARYLGAGRVCLAVVALLERCEKKQKNCSCYVLHSTSMAALQVVQLLQALAVVWREASASKLHLLNRHQK